jgi:hypothetical protein
MPVGHEMAVPDGVHVNGFKLNLATTAWMTGELARKVTGERQPGRHVWYCEKRTAERTWQYRRE